MSALEEAQALKKRLEKNVESDDRTEILRDLEDFAKVDITKEILQATMVGKTLWKLRKHADGKIASLSTQLTDAWKAKAQGQAAPAPATPAKTATPANSQEDSAGESKEKEKDKEKTKEKDKDKEKDKSKDKKRKREDEKAAPKEESASTPSSKAAKPEGNGASSNHTEPAAPSKASYRPGEELRGKVVELLMQALGPRTPEDFEEPSEVATQVEQALYSRFNGITADYKSKHRSISFNLKNRSNPELRASVMQGVITPEKLVLMTPEEMASEEMKKQRQKILDWHKEAAKVGMGGGTQSDMFTCSKCGSNKTTYYQMQTRSSDEPMTTFHTCTNCGKRWKS